MKKSLLYGLISLLLLALFSGCAPKLAQTKYGPEETQWKNYVSKSYREWEPPATPPPLSSDKGAATVAASAIEIVPEPLDAQNMALPQIEPVGNKTAVEPLAPVNDSLDVADTGKTTTYKVKKGDTLWTISKQFYNDGNQWKKIQNANMDQLPTPEKLKAGMNLNIPAEDSK